MEPAAGLVAGVAALTRVTAASSRRQESARGRAVMKSPGMPAR